MHEKDRGADKAEGPCLSALCARSMQSEHAICLHSEIFKTY